eukprot:scaffold73168_cov30-Tisochrysis_lutea.AAC.4
MLSISTGVGKTAPTRREGGLKHTRRRMRSSHRRAVLSVGTKISRACPVHSCATLTSGHRGGGGVGGRARRRWHGGNLAHLGGYAEVG